MKLTIPTLLLLIVISSFSGCTTIDPLAQYQNDADVYRLRHLENYGALIEEYYEKVGEYPFQNERGNKFFVKIPFMTQEQDAENDEQKDVYSLFFTKEQFRSELSEKLGREIRLWFDPQRVVTTKPLYYLYVQEKDNYYFVVYVSNKYPFTTNKKEGYNVVEITTDPDGKEGFWRYEDLIKNPAFRRAVDAIPSRSSWFDELQETHK